MKCTLDCVFCYVKQAISCMSSAGVEEAAQYPVLYELMRELIPGLDPQETPADNSTRVLRQTCERIRQADPYLAAKEASNRLALELYPRLKALVAAEAEPDKRLQLALRISVAGNVIDLGIQRDFDIEASLRDSLSAGFARDDSAEFIQKADAASRLYFLCDNAGEIGFDRILLETLAERRKAREPERPLEIVAVVKGGAILNDACLADAEAVGLPGVCRVVDTGCDWVGTPLAHIRPELRAELEAAELILSKGQGNFETLEHEKQLAGRCFMLMKAKCESVARAAGVRLGDWVLESVAEK